MILAHRGSALPWLVNDRAALRLRRIWCDGIVRRHCTYGTCFFFSVSRTADGPQRAIIGYQSPLLQRFAILPVTTKDLPIRLPGSRPMSFHHDASSAFLQLVNQLLNFYFSHVFCCRSQNTRHFLLFTRIELTTSAQFILVGVRGYLLDHSGDEGLSGGCVGPNSPSIDGTTWLYTRFNRSVETRRRH